MPELRQERVEPPMRDAGPSLDERLSAWAWEQEDRRPSGCVTICVAAKYLDAPEEEIKASIARLEKAGRLKRYHQHAKVWVAATNCWQGFRQPCPRYPGCGCRWVP